MNESAFWSRVEKTDGCWLWRGKVYGGYGRDYSPWGRQRGSLAHRIAWELSHGEIPNGLCICHHCDVRNCVNPAHLFLGTVADNNRDRDAKGRQRTLRGSDNWNAKLTVEQVAAIRSDPRPARILAAEYGIQRQGITNVRRGRSYGLPPITTPVQKDPVVGTRHPFAKLTDDDVRAIRADARLLDEIAADYGVSRSLIWRIRTRKSWKHVA